MYLRSMPTTTADQPTDEELFEPDPIPRDQYGRPLIKQAKGRDLPYTRCSTAAKALSDTGGLTKWKQRQQMIGTVMMPSLLQGVDIRDNASLDQAIENAYEVAGANESAKIGTTIHSLTEWVDNGIDFDPADYGDFAFFVEEYRRLTEKVEMLAMEQFVVNDELKVAGTFDRLVRLHDGRVVIGDIKTGKSAADSPHEAAVQMAIYGRSMHYDPETGERSPIVSPEGEPIDTSRSLLIHLPSNRTQAGLYLLDTDAAWEAALLAVKVRQWRSRKIRTPYFPDDPPPF